MAGEAGEADLKREQTRRYGRGAAVLSTGIGITGIVTYGYFALASHSLGAEEYGGITLLWSAVFITVSVLYRPVEQLLSRTIAERRARLQRTGDALRVAGTIQLGLGVLFAAVALAFREPLTQELFDGAGALYWILLFTVLTYAVSYFTRGMLAGSKQFAFYGLLVFFEATSRIMFAVAVAVGIATGQTVVALGIAAAPVFSLVVVPLALRRRGGAEAAVGTDDGEGPLTETAEATGEAAALAEGLGPATESLEAATRRASPGETEFTLAHGSGFAIAVLLIMLCEQTFLNAGPLAIKASEGAAGAALAGAVFNVLLIARAPLQLFQAIATSLLPHLTGLRSSGEEGGEAAFRTAVSVTLLAVAAFAASVALVMLIAGPRLMELFFGETHTYRRLDLVVVSVGMGLYLASATLNQAALAAGAVRQAATCWLACAAGFVGWIFLPVVSDPVLRVVIGFTGAAAVLCCLLYALYRRSRALEPEAA